MKSGCRVNGRTDADVRYSAAAELCGESIDDALDFLAHLPSLKRGRGAVFEVDARPIDAGCPGAHLHFHVDDGGQVGQVVAAVPLDLDGDLRDAPGFQSANATQPVRT